MSQEIRFSVDYTPPFSAAQLKRVFQALREAILDNWRDYADRWSSPAELLPTESDIQMWLQTTTPDSMDELPGGGLRYKKIDIPFSPLSKRLAWLFVFKKEDDSLTISVDVSDKVKVEVEGTRKMLQMEGEWEDIRRERGDPWPYGEIGPDEDHPDYDAWHERWVELEDTPSVWPGNRACLIHIFEKLKSVLPVRDAFIDDELLE
jgi:hypothetical protein